MSFVAIRTEMEGESRFNKSVNPHKWEMSEEDWIDRRKDKREMLNIAVKQLNDGLKGLALSFDDPLPGWLNNAVVSRIQDIAVANADWEDIDFGSLSRFERPTHAFFNQCWDVQDEDAHPRKALGWENA